MHTHYTLHLAGGREKEKEIRSDAVNVNVTVTVPSSKRKREIKIRKFCGMNVVGLKKAAVLVRDFCHHFLSVSLSLSLSQHHSDGAVPDTFFTLAFVLTSSRVSGIRAI